MTDLNLNHLRRLVHQRMQRRDDAQIDVAYHAKVSQSTVSAFLRGTRGHEWLTLWGFENYLKRTQDHERRDKRIHPDHRRVRNGA